MADRELAPVSVVVPSFNSEATIRRALESVFSQTLLPREIIIVDDASADGTRAAVNACAPPSGCRLRLVELDQNHGPSYARNLGWEMASETWIAFLDSDDIWLAEKIEVQMDYLRKHPQAVMCGHDFAVLDGNQDLRADDRSVMLYDYCDFLLKNRVSTPTMMLSRLLKARFPETLMRAEDYALWLTLAHQHGPIPKLSKVLAGCYKELYGDSGLSASLFKMELGELRVIALQLSLGRIGLPKYLGLSVYSIIKFLARVIRTSMRIRKPG